jgi:hypothetical protein
MQPAPLINPVWGSPIERERRRRINLCVWAYAYEIAAAPLVSDATYDETAQASKPHLRTGYLDEWWRSTFEPHTGQWIHDHPELPRVAASYVRLTALMQSVKCGSYR